LEFSLRKEGKKGKKIWVGGIIRKNPNGAVFVSCSFSLVVFSASLLSLLLLSLPNKCFFSSFFALLQEIQEQGENKKTK